MDRGDIVALLTYEAKKRPKVAALLDRVHELTDEEIDTADVPLKWYKQGLRVARDRARIKNIMAETEAAMGPLTVIDTSVNTKFGKRLIYTGPSCFVTTARGVLFELKCQDWFFVPEDYPGCWQNQVYFNEVPLAVQQHSVVSVERETRHQYICAWDEELPKRYPNLPNLDLRI